MYIRGPFFVVNSPTNAAEILVAAARGDGFEGFRVHGEVGPPRLWGAIAGVKPEVLNLFGGWIRM